MTRYARICQIIVKWLLCAGTQEWRKIAKFQFSKCAYVYTHTHTYVNIFLKKILKIFLLKSYQIWDISSTFLSAYLYVGCIHIFNLHIYLCMYVCETLINTYNIFIYFLFQLLFSWFCGALFVCKHINIIVCIFCFMYIIS